MGIVAVLVAATTAKSLGESMNRKLPAGKTINITSLMLASITGFMMLAVTEIEGGIDVTYLGTKGLLCSFIAAFVSANFYKFCMLKDITIKMPPEVPGVISNVFRNVFPYSFSVLACVLIDTLARNFLGASFAEMIVNLFAPLFSAADSYVGVSLIAGAMAFFWFLGIHGPSIVEPAVAAVLYANVEANLHLVQEGQQASHALTIGMNNFIACLGGTGCTLVVPFIFMLTCKSKQLKAVGKASFIPVCFNVNEPVLFAAPIVLNPYFFVPFILVPIVNVCIFKAFVDILHMNSFIYVLPWAMPGSLGLFLGTGMSLMALLLAVLLLAVDWIIYLPFCKAYDSTLVAQEAQKKEEIIEEEEIEESAEQLADSLNTKEEGLRVLVLCVGAGTSAMFANAINKGAEELNVPIHASAEAFGGHTGILDQFDMVILSPQVQSRYDEIKADADKYGLKIVKTKGAQYIALTKDPKGAAKFALKAFEENNE